MNTTMFLAQLWGPVVLAVGLGLIVSPSIYKKVYHDIEKEPLALILFGIIGIAASVAHILYHNSWASFPEGLISFFGWALLLKSVTFAIAPKFVDWSGDWAVRIKLLSVSRIFMIVVGIYFIWLGFFS